jgi:hypothetical protein
MLRLVLLVDPHNDIHENQLPYKIGPVSVTVRHIVRGRWPWPLLCRELVIAMEVYDK